MLQPSRLLRTAGKGVAVACVIVALSLGLAPVALAADPTVNQGSNPGTATTKVSVEVKTAYTITIPAAVEFTENDYTEVAKTIKATGVRIPGGKHVNVSLPANTIKNGEFAIVNGSSSITCVMSGDGTHDANGYSIDFASNAKDATTTKSIKFNVKATEWDKELISGSYKADLVFTVKLA